jgi:hypothetical protein
MPELISATNAPRPAKRRRPSAMPIGSPIARAMASATPHTARVRAVISRTSGALSSVTTPAR